MNISNYEDNIFKTDNYWDDCWILNGLNEEKKYTYDYKKNLFINNKTKFRSRLDRIYIKKKGILKLNSFNLIGNNKGIIPSDHFGIIIEIDKY